MIASILTALLVLIPGHSVLAHGGPVTLEAAGDGGAGVTVRALYKQDGHLVEEPLRLVLTGTGADNRRVGPVQLTASKEGRGFYTSGPILTPGRWEVTITAPEPNAGLATITVEAKAPQVPPATQAPPGRGGNGWAWWLGAAILLVALLLVAAMVRRHTSRDRRALQG
ncbi:MAG TPA: hypothetical protein DGT23_10865 [Micromonosporaceae bacterium]|nr:hypothetical protein [Micromonosporaceae bacterium]